MGEGLTRAAARNIFYGGSIFFFVVFAALVLHSHWYAINRSTDAAGLTEAVARGKHVWERNSCINCHTLLGEGAYFAPELGNVWIRYGGRDDPQAAREALKAWIQSHADRHPGPPADAAASSSPTRSSTTSRASWSGSARSTRRAGRRTRPAEAEHQRSATDALRRARRSPYWYFRLRPGPVPGAGAVRRARRHRLCPAELPLRACCRSTSCG